MAKCVYYLAAAGVLFAQISVPDGLKIVARERERQTERKREREREREKAKQSSRVQMVHVMVNRTSSLQS